MNKKILASVGAAALVAGVMSADAAKATEGYFLGGYGVIQSSLSGAGVANSEDAMSMSLNPAGIAGLGQQVNLGAALFMPDRGYTATGTGFVAPGTNNSGTPYFIMPNAAYSAPIDSTSAWGVSLYGNGGSNTDYSGMPRALLSCGGGTGVFCGGHAGVNLMQVYLQFDYAQRFGNFSLGVSPVLAGQMFSANGLAAFSGLSSAPASLTDNGNDFSFGAGLHGGIEWRVTPGFRLGLSGATETYMSKFSKYAGLFAGQGSFDIPAWVDAGVAFDVNPAFTVMADYKHIFYSRIAAIADSSSTPLPFGATGGPGFGWSDVDVVALGATFKATPDLTLRAGVEFNTNPVNSQNVTVGILAPGVTTSQFSGGASYKLSPHSTLDLAGYIAPKNSTSGPEVTPLGVTPGSNITESLGEVSVLAGWTYHFDTK